MHPFSVPWIKQKFWTTFSCVDNVWSILFQKDLDCIQFPTFNSSKGRIYMLRNLPVWSPRKWTAVRCCLHTHRINAAWYNVCSHTTPQPGYLLIARGRYGLSILSKACIVRLPEKSISIICFKGPHFPSTSKVLRYTSQPINKVSVTDCKRFSLWKVNSTSSLVETPFKRCVRGVFWQTHSPVKLVNRPVIMVFVMRLKKCRPVHATNWHHPHQGCQCHNYLVC